MIEETLQTFTNQDVPPSRLRVDDVLSNARRRARRRRTGLTTAACGLAVLALVGAAAVVRAGLGASPQVRPGVAGAGCVVDRLTVPAQAADQTTVTGIDPSGRYVIATTGSTDAPRAVLWTDGVPAVLSPAFAPRAVNVAGVVVGFTGPETHGAERQQQPVMYGSNGLVALPLPSGAIAAAPGGVNAHGDIAGTGIWADGSRKPVLWHTAGSVTVRVVAPAEAVANALTDDGALLGAVVDDQGARPTRWSADGAATALRALSGAHDGVALGVGGDWAVGLLSADPTDADKGDTATVSVRWNLKTGAVERLSGFKATAVSATGTAVGAVPVLAAPGVAPGRGVPVFWRDGHLTGLPVLAGGSGNGSVRGVSADGHAIVGNLDAADGQGSGAPVVWRGC